MRRAMLQLVSTVPHICTFIQRLEIRRLIFLAENLIILCSARETGCVVTNVYETDKAAGKERDFGRKPERQGGV